MVERGGESPAQDGPENAVSNAGQPGTADPALASNLLIAVSERRYDPKQIEPKWQEVWERERTWEVANEPDGYGHGP